MSFRLTPRLIPLLLFTVLTVSGTAAQTAGKTRNVIFVMTDGLRWQEVFQGADSALMNKESGVPDVEALKREYWRDTPAARREALLPFLWSVVARNGQIYGNRDAGSDAYLTNGLNFSYPGYSETLCGFADPRVDSNDPTPNPNVTVLEWLHNKPAYRGKVAAFGAWSVISAIVNAGRAGFPVNAGYDPYTVSPHSPRMELLNRLKEETRVWNAEPFDAFTFHTALEHVKQHKPRVLFLSLGETDEWSHDGRYALYLKAAARVDRYLKELWETVQSMPEYRGTTTLIFAPDHGRGEAPVEWKSHGQKIPDSKYIWMAFLGPDTRAMGERAKVGKVKQNQIAATLAALLGEDYRAEVKKAGQAITDVLPVR
ncbi:MAG: alkaline phosphatase family protein [Bryobacteraceae bacterium]|nr:alkaline phosphatase family protein [Bryobacteraceae bacterium]